jgi:hypothetical protein
MLDSMHNSPQIAPEKRYALSFDVSVIAETWKYPRHSFECDGTVFPEAEGFGWLSVIL